jgi:hypothetical protein
MYSISEESLRRHRNAGHIEGISNPSHQVVAGLSAADALFIALAAAAKPKVIGVFTAWDGPDPDRPEYADPRTFTTPY